MATLDVTLKRKNGATYDQLHPTTNWSQIESKPTTFTPTAHTHVVGDLSATGTPSSTTFLRGDGTWATPAGVDNYVNTTGDTMTGVLNANAGIYLNNSDITGVNNLSISDPGPNEGISWAGGNLWKIYETPNDLTTNGAGNLQIVQNTTRRATFNTSGQLELPVTNGTAPLVISSTTAVSNLNADLLDGMHAAAIMGYQSLSEFANGTLVRTSIDASVSTGDSFTIEIEGKSYSTSAPPFKYLAQGYLYGGNIINYSGLDIGANLGTLKIFEDSGNLCFWWARVSYWNSFKVNVYRTTGADSTPDNTVTAITNSTEPTGTKKVTVNAYQVFSTYHLPTTSEVSGLQTALDLKANLASPTLTGTPTAPTAAGGTNTTQIATTAFVTSAVSTKQDSATALTTSTSFGGDVSGTYNAIVVADDSHNHIISNVDGLQTALDGKLGISAKAADSELLDGLDSSAYLRDDGWNTSPGQDANTQPNMKADFTYSNNAPWTGSLVSFGAGGYQMQFNSAYSGDGEGFSYRTRNGDFGTWNNWNRIFHDDYHPNADTLTTARTLTIGSTGKTFNGSANVSWSLGEIGAAASSHTHAISDVTNLQTSLDAKAALAGATFTGDVYAPRFIANPSSGGNDTSGAWGIADYDDKLSAVRAYITDTYYPIYHSGNKPAVADVTGLQTALDGKANTSHTHAATDITTGTIATARLGSGTADTTTYLRGDNTWSTAGIATYSTATLYVKRIWSRPAGSSQVWTSRYDATTGAGTTVSTTSTWTTIALGYTPASTDQFMIEFSNSTSNSLEKGICLVGNGTFSSTAGMSVLSYDAYETVDGAGQLKIAKYYMQWYITGTSMGFRYGSKMTW